MISGVGAGATHAPTPEAEPGDAHRPGQGLYIKQVAQILGVSASVLRAWESERLITPGRSSSGYRVYSGADVDRLRRIRELIQQDGLNAAGVRRLLSEGTGPPVPLPSPGMHTRIQRLRKQQHKSLRDLAAETGVSASAISAIERGVSMPSTRTLLVLAEALQTTVPTILGTTDTGVAAIVRSDDRPRIDGTAPGVALEALTREPGWLDPLLVSLEPGAGSAAESLTGDGEVFVYVVTGEVDVVLDEFQFIRMKRGDSISFKSARSHRWINQTVEFASLVLVRASYGGGA